MKNFGRLQRVELREGWLSEAQDFTPWLSNEENLALLAETLSMDLELEAIERAVGPFRADILCKNTTDGSWVLIENQLERTDHTHLGQLITYAAGLHAVTIGWIAKQFKEEHRAACDWLNEVTAEDIRIFGVEVELWKIGDSSVAPKFNIVSKPNDWSKSVTSAKQSIDSGNASPIRELQLRYWTAVESMLEEQPGLPNAVKPLAQSWIGHGIGRTGVVFNFVINRRENWVRCEIYMTGENAKSYFAQLESQRMEIERKLGENLLWEPMPDKKDARISLTLSPADPEDEADWPRQHRWLMHTARRFDAAFRPVVSKLSKDAHHQETIEAIE